jgi:hypothetical protein
MLHGARKFRGHAGGGGVGGVSDDDDVGILCGGQGSRRRRADGSRPAAWLIAPSAMP